MPAGLICGEVITNLETLPGSPPDDFGAVVCVEIQHVQLFVATVILFQYHINNIMSMLDFILSVVCPHDYKQ